jgi:23S rRNA (cytosine1962-C5)-methyltransferase
MSQDERRAEWPGYELIDAGDGRRLERFGQRLVDRPAPTAADPQRTPERWAEADLRFEAGGDWTGSDEPWSIDLGGLVLELRPTAAGGLGLYPEQTANIEWLTGEVRTRARVRQPAVLNLFAHTGLMTLAAARAGAAVTHVDGARGAKAWARHNAELSFLTDRPIRWLVDDAPGFVAREGRRGRRYDGFVIDPPSFGHAGNRRWRLSDALPELLAACRKISTDDAFVLLTAHTTGIKGDDLAAQLGAAFGAHRAGPRIDVERLVLTAASGARLDLGWAARMAP